MKELFKNPKAQVAMLFIGLAVLGLIIWLIVNAITKAIERADRPEDTQTHQIVQPDGTVVQNNATPQDLVNFEARTMGDRLLQVTSATYYVNASPRCEAYMDAMKLTDNQLKAVTNYFKNKHPRGWTLAKAMNETTSHGCRWAWGFSVDYGYLLLERMQALNIP